MKKITILFLTLIISINPVACVDETKTPYKRLHHTIAHSSYAQANKRSPIKPKRDGLKTAKTDKAKKLLKIQLPLSNKTCQIRLPNNVYGVHILQELHHLYRKM